MSANREHFLNHGGRKRRYVVHLPRGYDGATALPVMLSFHGGGGNAEVQERQSRLSLAADRLGFMVVYPEGTGRLARFLTWNDGAAKTYAQEHKVDDVGFIRKVIDDLPTHYNIDSRRVYATGISNGAMFCYRAGCELADKIAAIGPVAGDLGVAGPAPSRPVPVIHFHGLKDPNVLFNGGVGPNQLQPHPHRSIPETIGWWVEVNGCERQPVEQRTEKDYVLKRYAPAPGKRGAPVVLYILPEGGHTWPGGEDITKRFGTGKLIESVNANAIMWNFFKEFTLP